MKMKATDIRRALALTVLSALLPALGGAVGDIEPVEKIEAAAHAYVQSLLPAGAAQTQITVLNVDRRLRLAQCASALGTQLPAGANLTARVTVNVTCSGPTHWSIYLPVVVEIVDTEDRIQAFLPRLEQLIGSGLVTLEEVRMFRSGRRTIGTQG